VGGLDWHGQQPAHPLHPQRGAAQPASRVHAREAVEQAEIVAVHKNQHGRRVVENLGEHRYMSGSAGRSRVPKSSASSATVSPRVRCLVVMTATVRKPDHCAFAWQIPVNGPHTGVRPSPAVHGIGQAVRRSGVSRDVASRAATTRWSR